MNEPLLRTPSGLPRARQLGVVLPGTPGRWNAITDVPGVAVGYRTLIESDRIRTGVTAIVPRPDAPGDPLAAGFQSLNGNGEMTGVSWIAESGTTALPMAITNTHAVGIAHAGVCAWTARRHPALAQAWLLPVAAETWDGYLNDINGGQVTEDVAIAALEAAASGPVEEGSVGGGTGMNCYGYAGGSGTASRLVAAGERQYTVGVIVQANFGARRELTIGGRHVGPLLADDDPLGAFVTAPAGAGSLIAIVATDAPLLPGQCAALARRVPLGVARTGTAGSHFSGDLFLAVSTANAGAFTPGAAALGTDGLDQLTFVPWGRMDALYVAVVQATEEAILNSMCANHEMTGRDGHRVPALPLERVAEMLR